MIQQDFGIALSRTINVLSSTKTQLFIASVMGFGRDDAENYEVTVLIQSADYVQLLMEDLNLISVPNGLTVSGMEVVNSGCLVASSFTCGQIFTVTIEAECSDEDPIIDLREPTNLHSLRIAKPSTTAQPTQLARPFWKLWMTPTAKWYRMSTSPSSTTAMPLCLR